MTQKIGGIYRDSLQLVEVSDQAYQVGFHITKVPKNRLKRQNHRHQTNIILRVNLAKTTITEIAFLEILLDAILSVWEEIK